MKNGGKVAVHHCLEKKNMGYSCVLVHELGVSIASDLCRKRNFVAAVIEIIQHQLHVEGTHPLELNTQ